MSVKIVVRHTLFLDKGDGKFAQCGARLNKGESDHIFPRDCIAPNGDMIFDFGDAETAKAAGIALQKYLNKQTGKKRVQ